MRLADAIAQHALADQPTDLYRYYDRSGCLLYVGISKSAVVRAMQHERTAAWWNDWAHMTRERYSSRAAALAAEHDAICREHPRHNVVHAGGNVIDIGRG